MPARKRRSKTSRKDKNRGGRKKLLTVLIVAILAVCLFISLRTKYWRENERLILTLNTPGSDVEMVVFDNHAGEIVTIILPGSTQVDAAKNLGFWKVGSLWQLGVNERMGGKLLTDTITKNLKIPTYLWADKEASGFASGNSIQILKAMLFPYDSNLEFGDKVRLGLFSLGVKDFKRNSVNLSNTEMLYKKKSEDGKESFYVSDKLPVNLLPIVSDPIMSKQLLKTVILDSTGKAGVAERVGEVIEVMGSKVASIDKKEKSNFGCTVRSSNKEVAIRVARVFSCKVEKKNPEGNFDIEIDLGSGFAERF